MFDPERIMAELVREFQFTSLPELRHLIDRLDELASQVQGHDAVWDEQFRSAWSVLEEVYAVMVDRGITAPNDQFNGTVSSATAQLRQLLSSYRE